MTPGQFRTYLTSKLSHLYSSDEINAISRIIVEEVLLKNPFETDKSNQQLSDEKIKELNKITDRLVTGEPIQYIIGKSWFYDLPFKVNKHVLIPRPETEELVSVIIESVNQPINHVKILDIGTGSGCIAITLKKKITGVSVTGIDISEKAIQIARENATAADTEVAFFKEDIFHPTYLQDQNWDIIVSNPPYIPLNEKKLLHINVINFEPHQALFVPDNEPLKFYSAILDYSVNHLKKGGKVYFEINQDYKNQITELITSYGFKNVKIIRDISGNDRIVSAENVDLNTRSGFI
jgi:release factor glutamine methyltransferase